MDLLGTLDETGAIGGVLASTGEGSYLYDGNGNVIALVKDGSIVQKLEYTPFGTLKTETTLPFVFSTKPIDPSGLSYYGYRFYDPIIGRWEKRDSIYEYGGLNLWGFVNNDPINKSDLFGLAVTPNEVAMGEIESWSVVLPGYTAPSGLGDAKMSLAATCNRNPKQHCRAINGSQWTAQRNPALPEGVTDPNHNYPKYMAWKNITTSTGSDKSNNANYFCIGSSCWWLLQCQKCVCEKSGDKMVWRVRRVKREKNVIVKKLYVGTSNIIYFVKDDLAFWCDKESYNLGTAGCAKKNNP